MHQCYDKKCFIKIFNATVYLGDKIVVYLKFKIEIYNST